MRTGDVAGAVGRGLAAGVAGTALMTLSSTIEMKVQGREASSAPATSPVRISRLLASRNSIVLSPEH